MPADIDGHLRRGRQVGRRGGKRGSVGEQSRPLERHESAAGDDTEAHPISARGSNSRDDSGALRVRRPAVLCVITAVVGGAAAAGASQPATARSHWRVLTLPVRQGRPYSFAEPGIAVGRRGVLILDAASANTGAPPTFWLSRDGGRRWAAG